MRRETGQASSAGCGIFTRKRIGSRGPAIHSATALGGMKTGPSGYSGGGIAELPAVSNAKEYTNGSSRCQKSHNPAANNRLPARAWMKYGCADDASRSHL